MTKATIATPEAEALLEKRASDARHEAHDLQSEATEMEAKASDRRARAEKLLDLAAQCEEAVRDLRAHRREHPRKEDASKKDTK